MEGQHVLTSNQQFERVYNNPNGCNACDQLGNYLALHRHPLGFRKHMKGRQKHDMRIVV